jgi:hypothetical protein
MPESSEQYRDRLAGYLGEHDPMTIQRETPRKLANLIRGMPVRDLAARPDSGKWSVVEILAHLAEDELASAWRYRQMIEHDGITLNGFDQDLWALLGNYKGWSATEALELFRLLREANLRMLESISAEQWDHSGKHVERGPLAVRELVRHMAAHDINHTLQIERLLAGQIKQPEPSASTIPLHLDETADLLLNTVALLRRRFTAFPARAAGWHPEIKKWCAKEIVGHLIEEDSRDFVGRIRTMVEEQEPALKVNDQDEVARSRRDCDRNLSDLLDEFEAIRMQSVAFVKRLGADDLDKAGIHPRIGRIRVRELLHEWVYHDLNHLRQIDANLQKFLFGHLGNMKQFYQS